MAFTQTTIILPALLADNPTFAIGSVVESPTVSPPGRWSAAGDASGGTFAATDRTDAAFPIRRAFDLFHHLATRPSTAVVDDVWFLVLRANNIVQGLPDPRANILLINGHNFANIASGVACRVETADDDAFTTNLTTINDFGTVTTDDRLLVILPDTFGNLERIRIRCASPIAANIIPEISEVWFSPRIVLERQPNLPWDEEHLLSDVGRFRARSGVTTTYSRYEGQRIATMTVQPDSTSEIDDLREAFEFSDHGTRPFLFIDNPQTNPLGYMMIRNPDNNMPLQGPFDRLLTIPMEEQAPFVSAEL